ncbi:hypothetical protein AGDE_14901 [Angomonas deanei]|uniref:Uncharacterized protein n=1 Tax=Angomonas deanei TaxID=59799 RepID=A0A7G2C3D1_9TRYP|nr:hypothetical protein AGDE_14901 [Angomonas deanei]CAD2214206.1 hypothetical protein, conserved [Angomonas deanei]|eukprot:EPY20033.1 hypothetical protein AGDE_14901 [Angomonas deanei]
MPDMSERGLTKPVKVFEGELSPVTLVNFVLESISPLALERVDNFRDVQSLFSLYPGYPKIPRILYFTNNDHVSPMLRSLSQQLAYSSVMGVVEEAFSTADKRAIAKHYGIESKAELPLFVVLFPSDGNRDEVVKVEGLQSHSVIGDVASALKRAARITDGEGDASTNHTYKLRLNYMVTEMNRRWVALKKEKVLSAKVMCHVIRNRKEWDDFMVVPPGQFAAIAFAKKEDISRAKDILINATRSIMEQMVAPVAQNRFMRLGVVDETLARDVRQFFKAGADGGSPSLVFIQRDGDEGSVYYDFNGKFVPERIAHVFVSIVGESTQKPHPFKMSKVPGLKLDVKDGGDAGDL